MEPNEELLPSSQSRSPTNIEPTSSTSHRDVWRQARQHISEYEAKAADLQLDLQQETRSLHLQKQELAAINKEMASLLEDSEKIHRLTMEMQLKFYEMEESKRKETDETQRLLQQRKVLQAACEADQKQFEVERQERESSLEELKNIAAEHGGNRSELGKAIGDGEGRQEERTQKREGENEALNIDDVNEKD